MRRRPGCAWVVLICWCRATVTPSPCSKATWAGLSATGLHSGQTGELSRNVQGSKRRSFGAALIHPPHPKQDCP